MSTNYENFDSPYDTFMSRGKEQGASGASDSLHSLNTAGSEGVPASSDESIETATNLNASQVATTENTKGNGNTENMPTKDSGSISDLWINTFIKSSNWKPKKQGFWLDGPTGYAEFVNVYVSGNINALTGNIGGWIIETGLLASASSGSRIELNSSKSRISIFDSTSEVVVMGYLNGLPKNDGSGNWGASNYGFWAKAGDMLSIDGDAEYISGDWIIQNDASYLVKDASSNTIIRLGTDTGEKGLFIYNTSGTQLAKLISDQIFVGNSNESLKYSVASGLEISDPIISDILVTRESISVGDWVAVISGGKVVKTNFNVDARRNYGIATTAGSPFTLLTGGTGYSSTVSATTGGTGTGCTVSYTASGGVVTQIDNIINFGSGYTDGDTLTINSGGNNATFTFNPNKTVKIQKTGPYTTTGLTSGALYFLDSNYGNETITIEQSTRNTLYDANLGVGQTFTAQQIFNSRISLYLRSPLGTGSYPYKLYFYELFSGEGGLSSASPVDSISTITRVGSTATATPPSLLSIILEPGDYVFISGADQPEYNGWHKSTNAGSTNTNIKYTVSGTPVTPATGTFTATYRRALWKITGNVSLTGTGENFIAFNLALSSVFPDSRLIYGNSHRVGTDQNVKYLFEFSADNAGEINIGYANSSVYTGGDLWLSGNIDTGKDLGFRMRERFGSGTITTTDPFPNGTNPTIGVGLARSTTKLLIGKYIG